MRLTVAIAASALAGALLAVSPANAAPLGAAGAAAKTSGVTDAPVVNVGRKWRRGYRRGRRYRRSRSYRRYRYRYRPRYYAYRPYYYRPYYYRPYYSYYPYYGYRRYYRRPRFGIYLGF